jgi:prepilin-type N-terminal cleavage/methylation domain-containing protein
MWAKQKQQNGFTIVELLIVIVVIGILAAITIVAYNGVQKRANNTRQSVAAKEYIKLIKQYKALNNDTYPTEFGCLGNNNVDTDSDGDKDCNDNGNIAVDNTLLTKLAAYGTLPDVVTKQITGADGVKRAGIRYSTASSALFYILEGSDATCDIGVRDTKGNSGDAVWCTAYLD